MPTACCYVRLGAAPTVSLFGAWTNKFDTLLVFSAPGGSVHPVESVEVDSEHLVEQVGVGSEALEVSAFSSRYSHSTLPQAWVSLSQLELVPRWWQLIFFSRFSWWELVSQPRGIFSTFSVLTKLDDRTPSEHSL